MMLSAFAWLLAAAEPLAAGEMARIFTGDDYPIESLMKGEKGTVAIEADVKPDGRVTACRVIKSSGFTRLDHATCAVVTRRARFIERAKEHGGKSFTISTTVTWDSKPMGIPLVATTLRIIYTTGPSISCRTESPPWMGMEGACSASQANAQAAIKRLSSERSLEGMEYVVEMAAIPGEHLADHRVGEGRGEQILGRQTALLTLAADGRVSQCTGGEDTLGGELAAWCESFVKNERYEPLPASADNRSERRITKVNAIYLRPAASQ